MEKILFYAMNGEKMCFQHVLLNALDLTGAGCQVKIIFEGSSVKLPSVLASEGNKLYQKTLEANLIAGICLACSRALGVYEVNAVLGLPFLDDMMGHAGTRSYIVDGWQVISM
ncbi:MAG: hypothetical protein PHW11_07940 [Anaerolineaceae bacterium]|jgi:hypothetical protein|nr:hypothetical protein [Anaerolineaceae bacterium]MDD4043305.1 hypothetical protein [Anaerolineaceae bacterium]MDD4577203.1 hypothetical protein [Anaerolineaceae bacterium]